MPSARPASYQLFLAAGVALAALLVPSCRATSGASSTDAAAVRVVSYNIKHGLGLDGALDLERVAAVLAAQGADVVLLQEVDERCGRSGNVDQAATLGAMLGMESRFAAFMDFDGGRYGLATLTRLQIDEHEVIELPPGTSEPRAALAVTVRGPGGLLRVVNAHLDWKADDTRRLAQAAILREACLSSPGAVALTVLGGDLNDVPGSATLALFEDAEPGLPAEFRRVDSGAGTFPADGPVKTIDHFLYASKGAAPSAAARVVPEPLASDHRPVVLDLSWPPSR